MFGIQARFIARKKAPGMGAVMRWRPAVGLPWRRGDQWGATAATFAGQERAAAAFERTARRLPRECRQAGGRSVVPKRLPVRRSRHEREQPGARKIKKSIPDM